MHVPVIPHSSPLEQGPPAPALGRPSGFEVKTCLLQVLFNPVRLSDSLNKLLSLPLILILLTHPMKSTDDNCPGLSKTG